MTSELEIVRRIWIEGSGAYVEIGDYAYARNCLELRTTDDESQQYFGKLSLVMDAGTAKMIGEALIASAKEKGA